MVVSKQLKKQIFIEVLALLFLLGVMIYAAFAIRKSNENKITSIDGMVVVIDDAQVENMKGLSDGQGLEEKGTTYTVTNNTHPVTYKVVLVPNVHDENVLKQVRVSTDDLYVETLTDLERLSGGYVIATHTLEAGFTKIHLVKSWYKLDTKEEILDRTISFDYRLVREE